MQVSFIEDVLHDLKGGHSGVLCILVGQEGSMPRKEGASMWVRLDGSIEGTVGGGPMEGECVKEALDILKAGDAVRVRDFDLGTGLTSNCPEGAVCGGRGRVYFEAMRPDEEIFIFGAGHVGRALARAARASGFRVTVWDERAEYANEENIPWAENIVCPIDELFNGEKNGGLFHANSYVVIVTRGHELDADAIRLLEDRGVAYIGVIGSRSKIAFVDKKLRGQGVAPEHLERVHRPIGLPIRGETPEEIAVSILAEIIAVKRGANVAALRNSQ